LSSRDATDALREGGRGTGSLRIRRARSAMVLAECALAVVLLAGAGLLLKSLHRLLTIDSGFDPHGVLALRLEFPSDAPPTAEERRQTSSIASSRAVVRAGQMNDLIERVQRMPHVTAAGFVDDLFITSQGNDSITIPGRPAAQGGGELNTGAVSPGFFTALRVTLRQGRLLQAEDTARKIRALWSPVVTQLSLAEKERRAVSEPVVVNSAFVQRFFPDADPIGKRFCIDPTNKTYWYEIVGVIGDMRRQGLEHRAIPEYFGPYFPAPNGRADFLVRVDGDPLAMAASIRQEVVAALPGVAVAQVSTADAQFAAFSAQRRLQTGLLTAFAALALSLAATGIFAVVRYMVAERTREIGVRVALGATPSRILATVVLEGLRMPVLGIALGLIASGALTRVLRHMLFDVTATDPATFGLVAIVLSAVASLACYVAARRTVSVDPARVLRHS
jgi:putative ABC transport system permease protein